MLNELVVWSLAASCLAALCYGNSVLPQERWQILASVPLRRDGTGRWQGMNLTWYGVLSAAANTFAVALALALLAGLGIPLGTALVAVGVIMALSMPAARIVARLVEQRATTFTVAGASWVGFTLGPWVMWGCARLAVMPAGSEFPVLSALACMAVAFPVGEGLGRLACLSFGCCYGKPLDQCHPAVRRLLAPWSVTFQGSIKKASYEGGLEGRRLIPIQFITAGVNLALGFVALECLIHRRPAAAYLLAVPGTQVWRIVSETLRADHRGRGKISAYQWMALFSAVYAAGVAAWLPNVPASIDLPLGLRTLWDPLAMLLLQGYWLVLVYYMGRSTVTVATLEFRVVGK